ncbi:TonB-dependent receptor [uncultured Algimonas sp.]|uniref:TonB-dependent receptor n=1 Tax=uncultured Algimonas sp. TaxID=1547920 RepID=UPI0026358A4E|nr:TonB-dependent receptor [uncultured Algimonas sp.]
MFSSKLHLESTVALIATASVFAPVPAFAQNSNEDAGLLDVIIVTAQRRAQNVQDVPSSITAISGDALKERGVANVEDLARLTPGLAIKTEFAASNPQIFLRGVGTNDFNANLNSGVGVYLDEVVIGSPTAQLFQFFDLDRVEVLRGPQGTLYGRNTTGGAINIYSRMPGDVVSASGRAEYGSYDSVLVEGGVDIPIGERVRNRVSAQYRKRDGLTDNRLSGDEVGAIDQIAARWVSEADLSDKLSATFSLQGGRSRGDQAIYQHIGLLDFGDGVGRDALEYADTDGDAFAGNYNSVDDDRVDAAGATLNFEWQASDALSFNAIGSVQYAERQSFDEDTDYSPNTLLHSDYDTTSRQYTMELRANYEADRYSAVGGAFYYNENLDFAGAFDVFSDARDGISARRAELGLEGIFLPGGFNPDVGLYERAVNLGGFGLPSGFLLLPENAILGLPAFRSQYGYEQETESWALFGQVDYQLSDRLTLTGGLRYTEEDRIFDYQSSFDEAVTIPLVDFEDTVSASNLSGRAALSYEIRPGALVFASYSRGFKSGGFNGGSVQFVEQLLPFEEETLDAFEAGVKADLSGSLRLNASVFHYDYNDLQVFRLVNISGVPQQLLDNASDATISGGEIEARWRPTPDLVFSAGISLLDTELLDFVTDPLVGSEDFSGNELPFAADVSGSVGANYRLRTRGGDLVFAGEVSFFAEQFTDPSNSELLTLDAYETADVRVDFTPKESAFTLGLFARNVFDEDFVTNVTDLAEFGYVAELRGTPRIIGARLRFTM